MWIVIFAENWLATMKQAQKKRTAELLHRSLMNGKKETKIKNDENFFRGFRKEKKMRKGEWKYKKIGNLLCRIYFSCSGYPRFLPLPPERVVVIARNFPPPFVRNCYFFLRPFSKKTYWVFFITLMSCCLPFVPASPTLHVPILPFYLFFVPFNQNKNEKEKIFLVIFFSFLSWRWRQFRWRWKREQILKALEGGSSVVKMKKLEIVCNIFCIFFLPFFNWIFFL